MERQAIGLFVHSSLHSHFSLHYSGSLFPRQFKRLPKQRNGSLNIGGFTEIKADPAALRQDVMRFGLPEG
jgi:hypothetical protein